MILINRCDPTPHLFIMGMCAETLHIKYFKDLFTSMSTIKTYLNYSQCKTKCWRLFNQIFKCITLHLQAMKIWLRTTWWNLAQVLKRNNDLACFFFVFQGYHIEHNKLFKNHCSFVMVPVSTVQHTSVICKFLGNH